MNPYEIRNILAKQVAVIVFRGRADTKTVPEGEPCSEADTKTVRSLNLNMIAQMDRVILRDQETVRDS